jgi:NADH:ubiquinone oxidoreductase subunit D/NADH:ubiquinone oxidoreductase subunit C
LSESAAAAVIEARFPAAILARNGSQEEPVLTLAPEYLVDVSEFLRDEPDAQYDLLVTLADGEGRMCYQLASTSHSSRLLLCVPLSTQHPMVDSVAFVWPAANWAEREAHDLWGTAFGGHPDLRPLLLRPLPFPAPAPVAAPDTVSMDTGCRYPTTLEASYVHLHLDNAQALEVQPRLGLRHVGIGSQLTRWPYDQGTLLAGRIDAFSAMHGDLAYALAVEKLLGLLPPPRAQLVRVVCAELQRIASHLYWLTRCVQRLSEPSLAAPDYAWEGRTAILNWFQWLGGNPIAPDVIAIGGLHRDVPSSFVPRVHALLDSTTVLLSDLDQTLTRSTAFRSQLQGVGVLDPGTALGLGVTGPTVRASGISYDVRGSFPYSGYRILDVEIPVARGCDAEARYLVRMAEMHGSIDVIRQALSQLPRGPVNVVAGEGAPLALPSGIAYASVEGPRGELGMLLVSDGSAHLRRAHIRGPSFFNLSALPYMTRRIRLDQLQTALDSLDVSTAEAER